MMSNKLLGRGFIKRPTCPFCELPIERPKEIINQGPGEMPVGSCSCGAVYACDETGHNLGEAMIEALVFGCHMDWDLAWGLLPEEDYREEVVQDYDYVNHLIVSGGVLERRRISGALYFIKLHEDVFEAKAEGTRKTIERPAPEPDLGPKATDNVQEGPLTRGDVERFVREYRIDPILGAAQMDKKLIRNLQRLLYSGDELFRNRAAEILGRVCAVVAEQDPGNVSRLLQRLFYSIVDTAAFTWGAFEAIGEIIGRNKDLLGGYVPQLYQFLPDKSLRAKVLRAMGRIAESSPDLLRRHTFHFFSFLKDPDPEVRGYTAWLLGRLGAREARGDLGELLGDNHKIIFYENGDLEDRTVGQAASEALSRL